MSLKWSDTLAAIAPAMAKAQSEVEGARKDSSNPAFKRDGKPLGYADLTSVWEACREAVSANGLSIIQSPGLVIDGKMHMDTLLLHTSGEWVAGELSIPLGKSDAQGYGSAVTYARRYALAAIMSVCPEDDDGNAASEPTPRQQQQHQPDPKPPTPSDDVMKEMIEWVDKHKAKFEKMDGATSLDAFNVLIDDPDFKRDIAAIYRANPSLFAKIKAVKDAAGQRVSDVPF